MSTSSSVEPHATEPWTVLCDDSFDRDTPTSVDVSGCGLVQGLRELWARYLFETVQADGVRGFSHFSLKWREGYVSADAYWDGQWEGARRLRQWMFGDKTSSYLGYVAEAEADLLDRVARTHAQLVADQKAAARIQALCAAAHSREDFERHLAELALTP